MSLPDKTSQKSWTGSRRVQKTEGSFCPECEGLPEKTSQKSWAGSSRVQTREGSFCLEFGGILDQANKKSWAGSSRVQKKDGLFCPEESSIRQDMSDMGEQGPQRRARTTRVQKADWAIDEQLRALFRRENLYYWYKKVHGSSLLHGHTHCEKKYGYNEAFMNDRVPV